MTTKVTTGFITVLEHGNWSARTPDRAAALPLAAIIEGLWPEVGTRETWLTADRARTEQETDGGRVPGFPDPA